MYVSERVSVLNDEVERLLRLPCTQRNTECLASKHSMEAALVELRLSLQRQVPFYLLLRRMLRSFFYLFIFFFLIRRGSSQRGR